MLLWLITSQCFCERGPTFLKCLHLEKKYISEFHDKHSPAEYGSCSVIISTVHVTDNLFGVWPIELVN